jgi:PHS family inorganic phosphate transporter-like MFS transporter
MIILVATFAQAMSAQGPAVSMTGVIVVWRFLLVFTTSSQKLSG